MLHARAGDPVAVLDGEGLEYPAVLSEVSKTKTIARLGAAFSPKTELTTRITIAQALPKVADKMEQVLQHGTEIGAAAFWGFSSARSQTHLIGERQEKRMLRWHTIVKTAAEQSHRALLADVQAISTFSVVAKKASEFDLALIAYEGEQDISLRKVLENQTQTPKTILIIIGPEGGFTEEEVKIAVSHGVHSISLGTRILRTETAAFVLLSQLLYALE